MCMDLFKQIIDKVCNARFGKVLRNYCKRKHLKGAGKINFRTELLAMIGRQSEESTAPALDDSMKPSASGSLATAISQRTTVVAFPMLSLSTDGAVSYKILQGKQFVIAGVFDEVDGETTTANAKLKMMIELFGGKVAS